MYTIITTTSFGHCGYIHSYSSYFAVAQQQMHPPQQQDQKRDEEEDDLLAMSCDVNVAQTLMELKMQQPQQHKQMNDGVDSDAMDEDDSSDEEYEDDDYTGDSSDDDPDALPYEIRVACEENDAATILNLVNNGIRDINCADVGNWTPILYSLRFGNLALTETLFANGGDPSVVTREGENALNIAVAGGDIPCIRWVLANTSIDINSRCKKGRTPLVRSLWFNLLEVSNFLVGRGANLFLKDKAGQNIINQLPRPRYGEFALGPQVLQHAKDLIWISVRPFFAVAWTSSSTASSLRSVFGNSDLLRQIAMFFRRDDIIARDPDEEEKPDEVKIRIEAALLLARENSKWGSTLK
jgi:hypothetical protein